MTTPNVLFVLTDQQRADSLGIENPMMKTPVLDGLAQESAVFGSCYTTSPVCMPARFSLMSGLYPHNLGVQTNRNVTFPTSIDTWVAKLRNAGFRTAMFGKNHLHPDAGDLRASLAFQRRMGFDDVDEVGGPRALRFASANITDLWERHGVRAAYSNDVADRLRTKPWVVRPSPVGLDLYYDTYVARSAAQYLRDYDRNQPWFCYVGFPGPHEPWDTPEPWASMYDAKCMPAPSAAPVSIAERPTGRLDLRLAKRPKVEPWEVAALRADYAGGVSLIDHLVGEILDVVRARGEWDRTIVVFTSDHGGMNGDAGLLYKRVPLEGAVRIPLLIRDPAIRTRHDIARPAELVDVGATVLDLAGATDDGRFRLGRSMAEAVRTGSPATMRSNALSVHEGEVMLVTEQWKIVLNSSGRTYLLFDRSSEATNLAGSADVADTQRELEQRVLERLVETTTTEPVFGNDPTLEPARHVVIQRRLRRGLTRVLRASGRRVPGRASSRATGTTP